MGNLVFKRGLALGMFSYRWTDFFPSFLFALSPNYDSSIPKLLFSFIACLYGGDLSSFNNYKIQSHCITQQPLSTGMKKPSGEIPTPRFPFSTTRTPFSTPTVFVSHAGSVLELGQKHYGVFCRSVYAIRREHSDEVIPAWDTLPEVCKSKFFSVRNLSCGRALRVGPMMHVSMISCELSILQWGHC